MPSDTVIDQADALMQRHRSFVPRDAVAPSTAAETVPDIPVLTEVVGDDSASPLQLEIAIALEAELSNWLAVALPEQIERLQAEFNALLRTRLEAELRTELLPRLEIAIAEAIARKT